jgi:hypothetical protein
MLQCNYCIGEFLEFFSLPFLYRRSKCILYRKCPKIGAIDEHRFMLLKFGGEQYNNLV